MTEKPKDDATRLSAAYYEIGALKTIICKYAQVLGQSDNHVERLLRETKDRAIKYAESE